MIYTAAAVGTAEAVAIGLVDEAFPSTDFEIELQRFLDAILAGSPFTVRRTKEALRRCGGGPAPVETRDTLSAFVEATQGADFAEGVRAFLEKRSPRFGSA